MTTMLLGVYAITLGAAASPSRSPSCQAYRRDGCVRPGRQLPPFLFISVPAHRPRRVPQAARSSSSWDLFPRIGDKIYPWDDPGEHFKNFFLPTMTLALPLAAVLTRLLRVRHGRSRCRATSSRLAQREGRAAAARPRGATPCATRCSRW